jgi:S1-C subfamily serine protease
MRVAHPLFFATQSLGYANPDAERNAVRALQPHRSEGGRMKLLSMVLAAALMPAVAFASPNNPQDQAQPGTSQNRGAPTGMDQGAVPQQTVQVEAFEWSTGQGRLGLMLMGLTPQLRSYFGAPNNSGLLVAQVAPNSPAARAGVRVGDVITQVDSQNVQSADDIVNATSSGATASANNVQIHVIRNHQSMNLQAKLGKTPSQTAPTQNQNSGT